MLRNVTSSWARPVRSFHASLLPTRPFHTSYSSSLQNQNLSLNRSGWSKSEAGTLEIALTQVYHKCIYVYVCRQVRRPRREKQLFCAHDNDVNAELEPTLFSCQCREWWRWWRQLWKRWRFRCLWSGCSCLKRKKEKKKRPILDHSIDGFSHPGPCKCNQTATTVSLTSKGTRKSRHSFKITLITSTL